MADVPVQIVVAAFKDQSAAQKALDALKDAQKDGVIKIDDAAVLEKDAEGKLNIKETPIGVGRNAALGGVLGAAIGIIAGPIGWAALGGAAIGGLATKLRGSGFQDARLKQIGDALTPGSSAIIAVVEHTWVAEVEKVMAQDAVTVATESIAADISEQLNAGGDVLYTAIQSDAGSVAARATVTPSASGGQIAEGSTENKPS
jgi:uncharacterized membrane protein